MLWLIGIPRDYHLVVARPLKRPSCNFGCGGKRGRARYQDLPIILVTGYSEYSCDRCRHGQSAVVDITQYCASTVDKPSHFQRGNAELVKSAISNALSAWGRADQLMPGF